MIRTTESIDVSAGLRARPVLLTDFKWCGLPPTTTILDRNVMNIEHLSPLALAVSIWTAYSNSGYQEHPPRPKGVALDL